MRTKVNITLIVTLSLLWLALPQSVCLGAEYYLDAVSGNDGNPGIQEQPWETWGKAQRVVTAGDTLYMSGNFGSVTITGADPVGTADNWITYRAWPGKQTPEFTYLRFDGTKKDAYLKFIGIKVDPGYVTTSSGFDGVVNLKGANHVIFEDSYFEGEKVAGQVLNQADFAPYVFHDNPLITAGVSPAESSYVTIKNSTLKYGYNAIYIVQHPTSPFGLVSQWIIKDNDFDGGTGDDYIKISNSSGHIISDNYFHNQNQYRHYFWWPGTATGSWSDKQWQTVTQDNTLASGLFYKTENGNFYIFADDSNYLPSRIYSNVWRLDSNPNIYFTPSSTGDSAHNDFIGVEGASRDLLIEKNIFYQGELGMQALKVEGTSENITVQNNLFYSKQAPTYQILIQGSVRNIRFYNNVIDSGSGNPYWYRTLRMNAPGASDVYLYNNILSGAVHSLGTIYSDYNVWNQPAPAGFNEGANSLENQNFDSGMFVDRAGFDYHFVDGSPAIDNGTDVGVYEDIEGTSRPQDGDDSGTAEFDIGAYEYVPATGIMYGDVSGDSAISAYDAALAAMHAVGLITLSAEQIEKADVTDNGTVSASDAAWIARRAVDATVVFPVEQ